MFNRILYWLMNLGLIMFLIFLTILIVIFFKTYFDDGTLQTINIKKELNYQQSQRQKDVQNEL